MNKMIRVLSMTVVLTGCVLLSGCGERVNPETETEKQTQPPQTEAVTEIQIQTEKQTETEPPTEPPQTEAVTEAPAPVETEPATEAFTPDLPVDEELAAEEELAAAETWYANDDLNVRETPTTEADNIIDSFDQGQEVTVIARTPHWSKVQIDDYTGYVHKDGLARETVEPKSEEERAQAQETAAAASADSNLSSYAESYPVQLAGDANLRSSASENGDVVDVIAAGTQVTALGESGDWYQVDYNGTIGYINRNLVQ